MEAKGFCQSVARQREKGVGLFYLPNGTTLPARSIRVYARQIDKTSNTAHLHAKRNVSGAETKPTEPAHSCHSARTRRRDAAGRPCCAACARVVDAGAGVL